MSDTVTITGNSTGYGAASGSETFALSGFDNTVLLAGANDAVTIVDGQNDSIDLNATGFTSAVSDTIDLGASTSNSIVSSNDLFGSTVAIVGTSGPNDVSLVNHAGATSVMLGYSGSALQQQGVVAPTSITLNGDATNTVGVQGSGGAAVTIGQAGDGAQAYASSVALSGFLNTLSGGDAAFTVSASGELNTVTLGDGDSAVTLAGDQNHVTLGNGNNSLIFGGTHETAQLGSGSNVVNAGYGASTISFGAGGAASSDVLQFSGSANHMTGGDESFIVTGGVGGSNTLSFGNGSDAITLGGSSNKIALGNGNNTLTLGGMHNTASFGTGNNVVLSMAVANIVTFAAGGAGSTDSVTTKGTGNQVTAGDENVTIIGTGANVGAIQLGNGNDVLSVTGGAGHATFGTSIANTAQNTASIGRGGTHLFFNGGTDQITLNDSKGTSGYDTVKLNGSLIGTTLDAKGVFDNVTLTHDANAAITEEAINGGMSITIDGDAFGGIGTISIAGLSADELAHIHLSQTSAYTVTTDNTAAGGLTLHFASGSLDLVGLHALPTSLFT